MGVGAKPSAFPLEAMWEGGPQNVMASLQFGHSEA